MLIFLSGTDSYLATQTIGQIKTKYLAKNDGAELIEFDESTPEPNWADLQAVPLFATSRLVIIRRLGHFPAGTFKVLPRILADVPSSTVVVIWDGKHVADPTLQATLQSASKVISVATPTGRTLQSWLKKRASELGIQLSTEELATLTALPINDLWWLETELQSRIGGLATSGATRTVKSEPFAFFSLIRRRDWTGLRRELSLKLTEGEPIELTIGALAAAVRKNLSPEEGKQILPLLLDIDLGLKTGFLDGESASALIAAHLPTPAEERVQWEHSWEEMAL